MFRQTIIYVAIIGLLIFFLLVLGSSIYFAMSGSFSPRPTLGFSNVTSTAQITKINTQTSTQEPAKLNTTSPTPKITFKSTLIPTRLATSSPTPKCGLTASLNLLYINIGSNTQNLTSEAVRLIKINPQENSLQVVSLPCNLWVNTPSMVKDYTISAIRLCPIIQMVRNSPKNNPVNPSIYNTLNQTLTDSFQINFDRYILTTNDSLQKSIVLLGNVDYISSNPTNLSGLTLNSGSNSLDPNAFITLFNPSQQDASPWVLLDRQNNLLQSIYGKYAQSQFSLAQLMPATQTDTNLSSDEITALDCSLKAISQNQVVASNVIQSNSSLSENGSIIISDFKKLSDELLAIFR